MNIQVMTTKTTCSFLIGKPRLLSYRYNDHQSTKIIQPIKKKHNIEMHNRKTNHDQNVNSNFEFETRNNVRFNNNITH